MVYRMTQNEEKYKNINVKENSLENLNGFEILTSKF
jgi:hypothetical protein